MIEFPPYRLDLRTERLWRGSQKIALRPKTWALLRYMAEHPEVLVSKDELVRAVWGPIAVSDDALTRTVAELRRRLGDDAHTPRVIETVHRRGFRFIAELAAPQPSTAAERRPSRRSRRVDAIDSAADSGAKPDRRES